MPQISSFWVPLSLLLIFLSGCQDPRSKPVENFLEALKNGDPDQLAASLSGPAYIMFMNFVPILECPQTKLSGIPQTESQKSACLREFYNDMEYSIISIEEGNNSKEAIITVQESLHGATEKKEYNVELIDGQWMLL